MIINCIYKIEKVISNIGINKLTSLCWHILKFVMNVALSIFYRISPIKLGIPVSTLTNEEVILSLTTFPDRIKKIPIVLETIFRQSVKPTRIILWLADSQFKDKKAVNILLKKYIDLGLEIIYCEDLRSHKKYFFAMQKFPNSIIITVDDDILYPTYMIEQLVVKHIEHPDMIICHRAHMMKKNKYNELLPYEKWDKLSKGYMGPDLYLFPTSGAGCLYPPNSLSNHVFDKEIFKNICFYADDIWLKCMAFLVKTEVLLTSIDNPEVIDIYGTKKNGLAKLNVQQNLNDTQIVAVTKYYDIKW